LKDVEVRVRQSHLVVSNAAIMWVTRVFLLIPQLILVPFLIRHIGDAGYGVYALVWSLMVSIDQLQDSLQQGVIKYSAGFLAQSRIDEVNKVISSSFVYSLLLATLACCGTMAAAVFYDDPSGQVRTALVVTAIMVLFIIPLTPYIAIIQSKQRYYVGAIAETASKYVSLLLLVLWFHFVGPSVEALIVIMAVMLFVTRLVQVPVAYRLVPGLRNRLTGFDRQSFRLTASFGAAIVFIALCVAANTTGVRWMMGMLASTSFVTHLSIILMPTMLLSQIILAVTITVMPASSAYDATGNKWMLQELLIYSMRYTTLIILAGTTVAFLMMSNVLEIWVGKDYLFLAPYALVLFTTGSFMLTTSTAHHMLKGLGRLRQTVFICIISLVVIPMGLIALVFRLSHEPYIAVTSGLAAGNVVYGILLMFFCIKAVGADFKRVFLRVYIQPTMVAAVVFPLAMVSVTYWGIDGFVGRTAISMLSVVLFFVGSYLFITSGVERRQVKEMYQLALGRIFAFNRQS
jgi:O-antigen/teichoic acid export membrane protein